jgi:hypothetical protein
MAWIDGKLGWLEPYFYGPTYKKELSELYLTHKHLNDMFATVSDKLIEAEETNEKLSLKIIQQQERPSVKDEKYWNNKFPRKTIQYPGDINVTKHLAFREIAGVTEIATDIIESHHFNNEDDVANAWNKWCVTNIETQTRRTTTSIKRFKYQSETKEVWRTPEQTLALEYGDCDDFMILGYYVVRKILMLLSKWEYNSHRLLCQVVFAFNSTGKLPRPAGWHANLLWIHSDSNYYTLETTFYASKALTNFGKLAQKYNPMYPLISFTFNGIGAYSIHDLDRSAIDFSKK